MPSFPDHPAIARSGCDGLMAFTLGRDLMVAPAPTPESPAAYDVCLPDHGWYDYRTGARVVEKPKPPVDPAAMFPRSDDIRTVETPTLARLPVFVRPGAIIAKQAVVANTAQLSEGPLELHVYPGPDCSGTLYADDGMSFAYKRGAFFRQAVRCAESANGVAVTLDAAQGATSHGGTRSRWSCTAGLRVTRSYGAGAPRCPPSPTRARRPPACGRRTGQERRR